MFTKKDLSFLKHKKLNVKNLERQEEVIKGSVQYIEIDRPAVVGDGILKPEKDEIEHFVNIFNDNKSKLSIAKFVPASGAATRMFSKLIYLRDNYKGSTDEFIKVTAEKDFYSLNNTFQNFENFPFYSELFRRFYRRENTLDKALRKNEYNKIARMILSKKGLNYANTPKALVMFHKYSGHSRTAFEEHLMEGMMYCLSTDNKVNIHFTIPNESEKLFEKQFRRAKKTFLSDSDVKFNIEYSEQSELTSSIALKENGKLLHDKDKKLVLRPGGHGALLENLNELKWDVIFIKNIDNVSPDSIKSDNVNYSKLLGGCLMDVRERVFEILKRLDKKDVPDGEEWNEIMSFVKGILPNIEMSDKKKDAIAQIKFLLNRPIRVCAMVENTSEPGGGPFWVKKENGNVCLQIVEKNQINIEDENQLDKFEDSTHFNPVDIVCCIKNYKGEKFNLLDFRDENTGLVVDKTYNGEKIKSWELPGLWNGGMSDWLSIFIELPISTFNPVKEMNDLLRVQHQSS